MSIVLKEYVSPDIIDVLILTNDTYFKGKNFANANQDIFKIDVNDRIVYASVPQVTADPAADNDLARRGWINTQLGNYQLTSQKNQVNGYAGLDSSGKVAAAQLPSYVDDVLMYANLAAFPTVGAYATVVFDTVTFTAVTKGVVGNTIALVFNGTDDIDTVVNAWNVANPANTVGFTGQLGTYVPTAGTATLIGGIDQLAESGKIYVAEDTQKAYRFNGSLAYIEVSPSPGTTDALAEGVVNLYFTEARVRATLLTGLASAFGDVSATDSILQAFGKINGNYLSRLNRPTLLSPIAGTTSEYTTIQAALNAIPAATDAASSKQVYTLFIPSGTYDEAVTYASNNRRVVIVCLGTVTMGDMTGSAWGTGGTPRDFTIANNGTATVNGIRTGTMICSIGGIGDGFSSHEAYLTAKFRVSGNLVLSSAIGISSEFSFTGIEVFGNLDTSGYSGNCNVYLKNSRIRGTAGSAAMRLQRACDCQFDGLVTTAVLGLYDKSNFAAGFTTSSASGDFTYIGFYNCTITGTYTGPAGSGKFDIGTNYWFVTNAATLAGGATKTLLYSFDGAYTPAQQNITLTAQHISDGYIDLTYPVLGTVAVVWPVGGIPQEPAVDYSIANTGVGGVGRLTITPGGTIATVMVAGDKLMVSYTRG
jgi:hypothetical protein